MSDTTQAGDDLEVRRTALRDRMTARAARIVEIEAERKKVIRSQITGCAPTAEAGLERLAAEETRLAREQRDDQERIVVLDGLLKERDAARERAGLLAQAEAKAAVLAEVMKELPQADDELRAFAARVTGIETALRSIGVGSRIVVMDLMQGMFHGVLGYDIARSLGVERPMSPAGKACRRLEDAIGRALYAARTIIDTLRARAAALAPPAPNGSGAAPPPVPAPEVPPAPKLSVQHRGFGKYFVTDADGADVSGPLSKAEAMRQAGLDGDA